MNPIQFLLILQARYRIILASLILIVISTLAVNLILPSKYTATTDILVDSKSTDPMSGMMAASSMASSMGFMATQVDIIKSQRVAIRAIKLVKIDQLPAALAQWKEATEGRGSAEAWLADKFSATLDVKPSRESNMLTVSYVAADPKFAATMANAFAQAYVDTTLELRVEPARQSAAWFDDRIRTLRENLENAQRKLSTYQQENGIVGSDERVDIETARLNELSTQLVSIQAQKADAQTRQRQAKGNIETSPDIMQNPVVQNLRSDIARQESKLEELGSQLGRNHPQYQRAKTEIESLREKLKAEMAKISEGMGAASEVSEKKESETRAALEAQKALALELKRKRDEISVLVRDVDSAQRAYDSVNQRFSQVNLESQLNQTSVTVLNPAVEPLSASSPKVFRNLLIATFLGTLIGVGLAMALEMADQRVRDRDHLVAGFAVPLLGVIGNGDQRKVRWDELAYRFFSRYFKLLGAR